MKLYSYWRSSAAYRVRIALHFKEIAFQYVPINLLRQEHNSDSYRKINPYGLVPALQTDDGQVLCQSGAIISYLEQTQPSPALLPDDPIARAQTQAWALTIACEIHPLNLPSVTTYLKEQLAVDSGATDQWIHNWFSRSFAVLEQQVLAQPYCQGDSITLADLYLIPQIYNALRASHDMNTYPRLLSIYESCNQLTPFSMAQPGHQPDAA
ncbi:MAG: maleylacetoacetate isomerase [Gammaproteobacteria bacterium]|nr:maleylacetoacetate isomerase [Gammaproteobacteria bacterium]